MIINSVKLNKKLLFSDEVQIFTDTDKILIKEEWNENLVNELNKKLQNFKIKNADDFVELKKKLRELKEENYSALENAIFSNIKSPWKFFNSEAKQVPRPMAVVCTKNKGIKEFLIFSLNARNFVIALEANRHVADNVAKMLSKTKNSSEEDILITIKEAIDKEHELVDFEIRIGAVFDNYENGKYVYENKNLTEEEQYKYVSKLIDKYSLVYAENPFHTENLKSYEKLAENYRKKCMICINNENIKAEKKYFNTAIIKSKDIATLKASADYLKEKKFNIVYSGNSGFVDAVVGLNIQLIKISDDKEGNEAVRRLNMIAQEILSNQRKN